MGQSTGGPGAGDDVTSIHDRREPCDVTSAGTAGTWCADKRRLQHRTHPWRVSLPATPSALAGVVSEVARLAEWMVGSAAEAFTSLITSFPYRTPLPFSS